MLIEATSVSLKYRWVTVINDLRNSLEKISSLFIEQRLNFCRPVVSEVGESHNAKVHRKYFQPWNFAFDKGITVSTFNPACFCFYTSVSQHVKIRDCSKLKMIKCYTRQVRNLPSLYLWFPNFVICNKPVRVGTSAGKMLWSNAAAQTEELFCRGEGSRSVSVKGVCVCELCVLQYSKPLFPAF